MQRFIIASLAATVGLSFMNKSMPFMDGVLAQFGSAEWIYFLLQGLIMVVVYKVVSGQLSGPGWVRGTLYGIILFGLSSFMFAATAGILNPGTLAEAGVEARGAAIAIKDIFAPMGALYWVITGALVGSIMQDEPDQPAA